MPSGLAGRRIVVTREAAQAVELLEGLQAAGAEAIALPTIAFAPPRDYTALDAALAALAGFDGCVFTSANAVRAVFARAAARGLRLAPPRGWVCAVGPATAAALAAQPGWTPTLVPAQSHAEGVLAELARRPVQGRRIFFPRSDAARERIPQALQARGAHVASVESYRTMLAEASRAPAQALFPGVDAAVFTSPSTARNLAALLSEDHLRRLHGVVVAVIGPVTRIAAEQLGWTVAAEAKEPGAAALVAALQEYWSA